MYMLFNCLYCTLHLLYNVYEFNVKSGTSYYIVQLYVKSFLLLV